MEIIGSNAETNRILKAYGLLMLMVSSILNICIFIYLLLLGGGGGEQRHISCFLSFCYVMAYVQ